MIKFKDKDLKYDTEYTVYYSDGINELGFVEGHIWAYSSSYVGIVEMELSKAQTKKIYEFMKRYYETGFGDE